MVLLMSPKGFALPWVQGASTVPLSSQERAPCVKKMCFALQTLSPLQPVSIEHPITRGGAPGGGGSRCGSGQGIAVALQRKSSSSGCASPLGSPLMEGTLTPSPRADAAGAAQQSVDLPGAWGQDGTRPVPAWCHPPLG